MMIQKRQPSDTVVPTHEASAPDGLRFGRAHWALAAIAVAFFAPYILWGIYIFPVADDLSPVKWERGTSGVIQTISEFWSTHGGAYSAVLFRWLHWPLTQHGLYWTTPVIFVVIHIAAGTIAFSIALRRQAQIAVAALLSAIWLASYIVAMESPAENVFWVTGMLAYEPGNALTLILTGMTMISISERRPKYVLARIFLIPAAVGCHFPYALFIPVLLAFETTLVKDRRAAISMLLWSLVFSSVVLGAPGNVARHEKSLSERELDVARVIFKLVFSCGEFLARECALLANWLLIGVFATLRLSGLFGPNSTKMDRSQFVLALSVSLFPVLGIFVLSEISGIDPPYLRTRSALHYLMMSGICFLVIPCIPSSMHNSMVNPFRIRKTSELFLCLIILEWVFVLFSPSYVRCVRDLIASGRRYRQHWVYICQTMERARRMGMEEVTIKGEPDARPVTVFHRSSLTDDATAWPNPNYARFFDVKRVVAERECCEGTRRTPQR